MNDRIQYGLVSFSDGRANVTAYIDGEILTADSSNGLFDKIVEKLKANDRSVVNEFDLAQAVNKAFHAVTDRVSLRLGVVYLDEKPVDSAMSKVVMDYVTEGNENLLPLVRFLERLDLNPSYNSRTQFWNFVRNNDIHIDDDGYVILYKAVWPTSDRAVFQSSHAGTAVVNGVLQENQRIQTRVGDVVTMDRRDISDDPSTACHAGLHAGSKGYAEWFLTHSGSGYDGFLITVRVDPAHVVSVPNDSSNQKVRVERYEIMERLDGNTVDTVRWADPVRVTVDDEGDDDGYCCSDCEGY